jgi:hypothetical protein
MTEAAVAEVHPKDFISSPTLQHKDYRQNILALARRLLFKFGESTRGFGLPYRSASALRSQP